MAYKLGRLPPPPLTQGHMLAAHHMGSALASLGPSPDASPDYMGAVTELVGEDWDILGNDRLGDCTAADGGHTLMLRTANVGTWLKPSEADVVAFYTATTGYDPAQTDAAGNNPTDRGADEAAICAFNRSTGLLGHTSAAFAPVATGTIDAAAIDRIKWCIVLFGSCRLGVNLPRSASDQFDARQDWTVAGDLTLDEGHDVPAVKYDKDGAIAITWGRPQRVAWDWLLRFGEEAWGEVWPDFMRGTGLAPSGFDVAGLVARLGALTA